MEKPEYIHMPTDEALKAKWARGAEQYGAAFVGHPLLELDEELLDAINYVAEAERQGWEIGEVRPWLLAIREGVRRIYGMFPVPPGLPDRNRP